MCAVAWTQKAWHGGGYQYRIAPASGPLNEAAFQKRPLQFVGPSSLRWGGAGGERLFFNATDVSIGTTPAGSTWRKCPIPRGPWGWIYNGPAFEPVCEESAECKAFSAKAGGSPGDARNPCRCSGDGIGDLATMEMVDKVHIPADLPAGEYVVGWRCESRPAGLPLPADSPDHVALAGDCEESTQVWQSCSDVTIKKA